MIARRAELALIGTVLATGYVLVRFIPAPARLSSCLADPHGCLASQGTDAAVGQLAGTLLWLSSLWLAGGLLACALSRLPGTAGRLAGRLARCTLPASLRNLVIAATGASMLLSPATAFASPVAPGTGHPPAHQQPLTPAWPLDPPPSAPPAWPTDPAARQPIEPGSSHPGQAPATAVTVNAGDSLWTITSAQLGPSATDAQIALQWPYWYRANRAVIGADPGQLRPGARLLPPATADGRP